ncbi:hypothetical protein C2845_PM12G13590 [Panicum miliaceum]|uniref:Replication factor A C-terminal domain-containing protein n=1 Tax=Panicum miliaceum TaxID=4540 RepID=A0A3L6QKK0_PANMI|nr:hypothetical protein C2845_PM12G13590 [Panicum miliaceum]
MKTAKRHGDSYKCTNSKCGAIGVPSQRFKLSILAGDEMGDTDFIVFGRQAQRLVNKTADTLVADNPASFIPDELTRLLERTFTWSVSFTDSTTDSDNITFQVNAIVGEVNDGGAVIPATSGASQTSSIMFSGGASTSLQNTGNTLTVSSLPAAPEASLASSTTPNKTALGGSGPADTPQSKRNNAHDQDKTLAAAVDAPGNSSTKTRKSTTKKSPSMDA